jgi:HAD superfamily hydrolase (TIGR01509 family)
MPAYQGVLLDLFGTLVHFDPARLPVVRIGERDVRSTLPALDELLATHAPGVAPAAFRQALGAVSEELAHQRMHDHVERPSIERFRRALVLAGCTGEASETGGAALARAHHRTLAAATVLPAAHGMLLDELRRRRHRLAVVSNFDDTAGAYDVLERHGILTRLDAVVVSERVGLRKPHPRMVETALRMLEVPASSGVLVGDTFAEDVAAAHAAGIDAAWIDRDGHGVPASATPPRFVLRTLPELGAVLAAG